MSESHLNSLAAEVRYKYGKKWIGQDCSATCIFSMASATCLAPCFRLVQICEKRQHEGDLEGIDALLGEPIV